MGSVDVFVSRPTTVSAAQESFCEGLVGVLAAEGLRARTLGVSDYPTTAPLAEVLALMKQCRGAIVLGLRQVHVEVGKAKEGSSGERALEGLHLASPWNQIEAGVAVALDRPLLVTREQGVEGGVFDAGSSDRYVHQVELSDSWLKAPSFRQPFESWVSDVRAFLDE